MLPDPYLVTLAAFISAHVNDISCVMLALAPLTTAAILLVSSVAVPVPNGHLHRIECRVPAKPFPMAQ
jgi:hypothetical protein